jgi:hypothetical protein
VNNSTVEILETYIDVNSERIVKKTDSVVDSVIDQFIERSVAGKLKYGTTMDRNDLSLSEWIEHAIQEHLDSILYLKKIKNLVEGKK